MNTPTLKTIDIQRQWHLIDLNGQTLGRIASRIAQLLMGKGKVLSGRHLDNGDYVVAVNAAKVAVTGKKLSDKIYYSHSGYPGNLKELTLSQLMAKDPRKVIEKAVKGMLPKDKHQKNRLRRLKVFVGTDHPYATELKLAKENK